MCALLDSWTRKAVPYDHWRHANPEDTLRFYAFRLVRSG
jgi:hypothetical protein